MLSKGFFAVVLILLHCPWSPAKAEDSDKQAFAISKDCAILEQTPGSYKVPVDLGNLPSDASGTVSLNIFNPTATTLEVGRINVSCACTSTKMSSMTLTSGTAAELSFVLSTPSLMRSPTQVISIALECTNSPPAVVEVYIRYGLAGSVAFRESFSLYKIPEGSKQNTTVLPLQITDPVKAVNLVIEVDKKLPASAELRELNDQPAVYVTFADELKDRNLGGLIKVTDKVTGRSDTHNLFVTTNAPLQVTPSIVRMRPTTIESKSLEGFVILRILADQEGQPDGNGKVHQTTAPLNQATLDDYELAVSQTMIGSNVYRIKITASSEQVEKSSGEIQWRVVTGSQGLLTAKTKIHKTRLLYVDPASEAQ